jgi:hypothetical protein
MSVIGSTKRNKLEANKQKRLERGAKKMQAKALRQARKLKEKND